VPGHDRVRLDPPGRDAGAALKAVKEKLRAVPDNGVGYGLLRGRLGDGRPEVLFNYLGRWAADGTADWDSAPEVAALRGDPDPDLGTPCVATANCLRADHAFLRDLPPCENCLHR
jgi:hypothetical protein